MADAKEATLQQVWQEGAAKANAGYAQRRIIIDPITRLEGHGKVDIFLDEAGQVERAYFQVPELRGFEKFVQGRPAEDMPQITSRICGVCPTAHHMAATKALDDLYHVDPPPAAKKLRELYYSAHFVHSHIAHFYALAAADFVMGPDSDPATRNILGVAAKVGHKQHIQIYDLYRANQLHLRLCHLWHDVVRLQRLDQSVAVPNWMVRRISPDANADNPHH
jgi:Ni,Fe-hydrogenase I large subunit